MMMEIRHTICACVAIPVNITVKQGSIKLGFANLDKALSKFALSSNIVTSVAKCENHIQGETSIPTSLKRTLNRIQTQFID